MTEEYRTAKGLIELFGNEGAMDHVKFVLSAEFGLKKTDLQQFWLRVALEIYHLWDTSSTKTPKEIASLTSAS